MSPRRRPRLLYAGLASLTAALVACGGGGGRDDAGFTLWSSEPREGATDVARDAPLTLNFSEAVAQASLTNHILLSGSDTNHEIGLAVSGPQVTVTPARRLLPLT